MTVMQKIGKQFNSNDYDYGMTDTQEPLVMAIHKNPQQHNDITKIAVKSSIYKTIVTIYYSDNIQTHIINY